jgi:hypothetical protein
MTGEPGLFEAFYDSAWQHPWLLWAAAIAGVAFALSQSRLHPSLRRYALALGVLSGLDAWLTSSHVYGDGAKSVPWDSVVQLFFVLAGDFRYLLLVVAGSATGRLDASARDVATALGFTMIVPIASQLVLWALPEGWSGSRVLFLVYELMFLSLAGALAQLHPNVRRATWLRPLTRFVQLYYGLWATADVVLLATGADLGFALRVVPNALYYGGLIGAIAWLAARASAQASTITGYASDRS